MIWMSSASGPQWDTPGTGDSHTLLDQPGIDRKASATARGFPGMKWPHEAFGQRSGQIHSPRARPEISNRQRDLRAKQAVFSGAFHLGRVKKLPEGHQCRLTKESEKDLARYSISIRKLTTQSSSCCNR